MTTTDQIDRLKCADTLLSGHYRDITAKDIALSTAYSCADIAESLRTIATRPEVDPVEAAIETVARSILAGAAETAAAEGWERYPEIGERDWARVGAALERLAPYPPTSELTAAYGLLEGRADHE